MRELERLFLSALATVILGFAFGCSRSDSGGAAGPAPAAGAQEEQTQPEQTQAQESAEVPEVPGMADFLSALNTEQFTRAEQINATFHLGEDAYIVGLRQIIDRQQIYSFDLLEFVLSKISGGTAVRDEAIRSRLVPMVLNYYFIDFPVAQLLQEDHSDVPQESAPASGDTVVVDMGHDRPPIQTTAGVTSSASTMRDRFRHVLDKSFAVSGNQELTSGHMIRIIHGNKHPRQFSIFTDKVREGKLILEPRFWRNVIVRSSSNRDVVTITNILAAGNLDITTAVEGLLDSAVSKDRTAAFVNTMREIGSLNQIRPETTRVLLEEVKQRSDLENQKEEAILILLMRNALALFPQETRSELREMNLRVLHLRAARETPHQADAQTQGNRQ